MNLCQLLILLSLSKSDFLECISEFGSTQSQSLMSSGKNVNDLGNMQQCQGDPLMHYYFANLVSKAHPEVQFLMGLCINKNCHAKDLNDNIQQILTLLEKQIDVSFLNNFDISITDTNNIKPSFDFLTAFIIFISVFILIFSFSVIQLEKKQYESVQEDQNALMTNKSEKQ